MGGLCLGTFSMTPTMAAPVTYTFTGVVTVNDSAQTPSQPFTMPAPLSSVSRSKNRATTQLVGSNHHTTKLGSLIQVTIGSYQVHVPFGERDQRRDISIPNFSKSTLRNSTKDGFTLTPSSAVISWTSQGPSSTLEKPTSIFGSALSPEPTELPPSIGALSHSSRLRFSFDSETTPPNPVTVAQGMIFPATTVPLPASLIIVGVGLVALIGLGAGGLRTS